MSDRKNASDRMIGYYSYLFTFPNRLTMLVAIVGIAPIGCGLAYSFTSGTLKALNGVSYGFFGLSLPLILSDALIQPLLRNEKIVNPRRITIITYSSSILYTAIILVSSIIGGFAGRKDLFFRSVFMGAAVNLSIRLLTIQVFTSVNTGKKLISTILQPSLCLTSTYIMFPRQTSKILILGLLGLAVCFIGILTMLWILGRWKSNDPRLKIIPMFQAFMLAWTEGLNEPLEELITVVGRKQDLPVDSILFGDGESFSSAIVAPYIHPGPIRNVGSSNLPEVLVEKMEEKLGCKALVSHGVSTHERDLTKSEDSKKVAEALIMGVESAKPSSLASPMVWSIIGEAQASCQLFGDVALITLTLSPKSYDDLPVELADKIMDAAGKTGFTAIVVDSHNSLDFEKNIEEIDLDNLREASLEALQRAKLTEQKPFAVGASRVIPGEWGAEEGMGPSGIAALIIRLENVQTTAYIVIDGNNMLPGLRERINSAVKNLGINECEVMTSDIHLVTAIGKSERGYYTIGERTDEQKVVDYVLQAVGLAVQSLQKSNAYHTRTINQDLTVLGTEGLAALSNILESGFSLFKKAVIYTIPLSIFIATVVVYLL